MRRMAMLVLIILLMPATMANARSVHSTSTDEMFPQGDMTNGSNWEIKRHLAFTAESAPQDGQYVMGMVADNHMTMGIQLPEHLDYQTVWASSTSTNSNASLGAPDGAYHYSTGPDIRVGGFDVSSLTGNSIKTVELVVHFEIPDALLQDKTRFSVIDAGTYDLVKTWSNTQSGLYYMNSGWSIEISNDDNWTWDELANIEIDLDYVSNGGTDDSQLRVDAVGLKITMRTAWYGAERLVATSTYEFNNWPLMDLDLNSGTLDSVSTAPCGLDSDGGTWTTEALEKPPAQNWGRIHLEHTDEENGNVTIEYKDNQGAWVIIQEGTKPVVSSDLQLRFTITNTCLTKAWIDINDPKIRVQGSISGEASAMVENATRWTIVVNGLTVENSDATNLGDFDLNIPIGHALDSTDTELEIKIKVWYNWGNDGSPTTLSLRINNIEINGAYLIEYDEDPVCGLIGSHDMEEDGGGLILPLLSRCSDDRTSVDDLVVTFENTNTDLIEVDLTEGQIRVRLIPEASGVAEVTTTVTDSAGNFWSEVSTFNIANVNDEPVLEEFPGVVPVEHGYAHNVSFELSDVDTFNQNLVVTTNRSWVTVNMETRQLIINAPTPGFTSVLVTACDESNCVDRVLDLEVRALAELYVEEIRINEDVRAGEIFEVKVFVRNSGQVQATMIGVRCTADGQSFGSGTIQLLQPGQLGSVICDMQAPDDDDSLLIEAEVDRGTSIDEVDEDNNMKTTLVTIGDAIEDTSKSDDDSSISLGPSAVYIASGLVLAFIVAIFVAIAPPKIKKLE
jgi:hypothetical protein